MKATLNVTDPPRNKSLEVRNRIISYPFFSIPPPGTPRRPGGPYLSPAQLVRGRLREILVFRRSLVSPQGFDSGNIGIYPANRGKTAPPRLDPHHRTPRKPSAEEYITEDDSYTRHVWRSGDWGLKIDPGLTSRDGPGPELCSRPRVRPSSCACAIFVVRLDERLAPTLINNGIIMLKR